MEILSIINKIDQNVIYFLTIVAKKLRFQICRVCFAGLSILIFVPHYENAIMNLVSGTLTPGITSLRNNRSSLSLTSPCRPLDM